MLEYQKENLNGFTALDSTTPWFEFLLYQECCWSLEQPVSLKRFLRYNAYLKEIGVS
jgi:hypothetical protein